MKNIKIWFLFKQLPKLDYRTIYIYHKQVINQEKNYREINKIKLIKYINNRSYEKTIIWYIIIF